MGRHAAKVGAIGAESRFIVMGTIRELGTVREQKRPKPDYSRANFGYRMTKVNEVPTFSEKVKWPLTMGQGLPNIVRSEALEREYAPMSECAE